jgi:hypothetical protein
VQGAESKAVDSAFAIFRLPRVDGPATAILTLPLRHGGLCLSHSRISEGSAAYLAAAATTHQAMHNGPETFRPFDGPSGTQLRAQWAALHCSAGTLWSPGYQEVSHSTGTITAAQRDFTRQAAQTRAGALPDALTPCRSPSTPARQKGRAHRPAAFSAARAALPQHGSTHSPSPRLSNSRAEKSARSSPPPWHQHAALQCPCHAVQL